MEQLYTVGQVSKLKGVSPRMLHYYDELGILAPRSVDPNTGYRRYTLDQMLELDAIRMCVDAGIPLADLAGLQGENPEVMVAEILKEAQLKLAERIDALRRTKLSIDDYLLEFADERAMPKGESAGSLAPSVAVALSWSLDGFDAKAYLDSMTELEMACRQFGLARFLKRGMVFSVADGRAWTFIGVASVDGLDARAGITVLKLPEGPFRGIEVVADGVSEAFAEGFSLAKGEMASPHKDAPACVTLTERWGAGLGEIQCAVLFRAHENGLGMVLPDDRR